MITKYLLSVGAAIGDFVWRIVGCIVGYGLLNSDGVAVGATEGFEVVGANVGLAIGASEGGVLGVAVGISVGKAVGAAKQSSSRQLPGGEE